MCGGCYPRVSEAVNHPLIPGITDTRLDTFLSGPYASQRLDTYQDSSRHDGSPIITMSVWSAPNGSKPGFEEAMTLLPQHGRPFRVGDQLGPSWSNHWVKVDMDFPPELRKVEQEVFFEFDPSAEALIFTPDGVPLHGLTGGVTTTRDGQPGNQSDRRVDHIIPPQALQQGTYSLIIEVSCNGMFGVPLGGYRYQTPDPDRYFPLVSAAIVVPNLQVRALRLDFNLLVQIARTPDPFSAALQQRALKAANDVISAFRVDSNGKVTFEVLAKCRALAAAVIGDLSEKGLSAVAPRSTKQRDGKVWAIGHCHIDTAWLWRYTQTQQKVARSWSTQCDLMDRWSNHQFAASSAQQYYWLETLYPAAFERVKHYVKEGRFHPVGGAWLEHDSMIPSGESLIRQYLYGQRYFRSRFGAYSKEAWLPDTFGYASQLPQILRGVGLKYFFTQKLSWNNINKFSYSSFNWVALDGSVVMSHMTPVDSYNSQCDYDEIVKGSTLHKNLAVTDEYLLLFGNGDGGGGPTGPMLDKLDRLSALSTHNAEVPDVKMGSPSEFFEKLMESTDNGQKLPTWRGELYFEYHRGTYTTQAQLKKGNKLMETLLRDVEYFATLASIVNPSFTYPQAALDQIWQDVLLNQFHDCLPGTTIAAVVDDILEIYTRRSKEAQQLLTEAKSAIWLESCDSTAQSAREGQLAVLDTQGSARSQLHRWSTGDFSWINSKGNGHGTITSLPDTLSEPPKAYSQDGIYVLENNDFRLGISNGRITSLFDLALQRDLILPGSGTPDGGLMIYEDYPLRYDAWDVEIYHQDSYQAITFDEVVCVEEEARASLVCRASFGKSTATLTFSLDVQDQGRPPNAKSVIRVRTEIDWHEEHKFLKFVLPVDIHSPTANYGTQFGICPRPTHRNTTQDQAKFECCAHGFADLSEAGYGVSFLARDKFGYSIEGNVMRLSMLRGPKTPDPRADGGRHDFEFGILPHLGGLAEANVPRRALEFTTAPHIVPATPQNLPQFELRRAFGAGLVIDTVKRGVEDESKGTRSLILRIYESLGGRAHDTLTITGLQVRNIAWVNLLEEDLEEDAKEECQWADTDGVITVEINSRCFEIKTLKIDF